MGKLLKISKFKNEDQERNFWAKVDLGDYFEPKDFVHVDFPNLKGVFENGKQILTR